MSTEQYPAQDALHLAERLDRFLSSVDPRRCVLRDDNQQYYHGVARLSEGPTYVELR